MRCRFNDIEIEFFLDLARNPELWVLVFLKIAGHQREGALWPTRAARKDNLAVMLNQRADGGVGFCHCTKPQAATGKRDVFAFRRRPRFRGRSAQLRNADSV